MENTVFSCAKRGLRSISVAVFSLGLVLGLPAVSWACTAQVNSIFVNPCADTQYGDNLVQFESNMVQAYLAQHGLPSTDSYVVYTYGRSDLRTEIRALMLLRLYTIIVEAPANRNALEASLYNWFLNRVWTNEKAMTQAAVNDKNSFLSDECHWTPDADIASQYGFVYEGGAFCGNLLGLAASPTVPGESYFQAAAFKNVYANGISNQPGGSPILATTASSLAANQEWGIIPAVGIAGGVGFSAGYVVTRSMELAVEKAAAVVRTQNATLRAQGLEETVETVEDAEPETIAGETSLGPIIVVSLMIEAGISAGTEAYEADQTLATLGDLDTLNTASHATPPDLLSFLNDPVIGILKLNASFVSATLPEVFLTTPLPTHRSTDPVFQISPVGGQPVSNIQMSYQDWAGQVWTASTWGGWLVQTSVSGGNTVSGITATIRGLYPGTPTNDQITAGRFSADRFTVAPTNSFNIACPIDPATGESDTQGTQAVEFCGGFVVRQLLLLNGSGVLQNVTLPNQILPVFPDGPTRNMNFPISSTSATVYTINATGSPTPSLTVLSPLPPGFTFVSSAALGILGEAQVIGPLNVQVSAINSFIVQATNNAGSAIQTVNLNYTSSPITYLSPGSVTFTRGLPATFNVSVLGIPPLAISAFFKTLPDGMTFVDHGGGSATISGTPALDAVGCDPNGSPVAIGGSPCVFAATDENGHEVDQFFTITVVSPPAPQLSGPTSATFSEGNTTIALFKATGAQTPAHFTAAIPAAIAGWLSITDFGDGTAEISGTPPAGSSATYNATVFLAADGVAGSVQQNFAITIIGTPVFTSANSFSAQVGQITVFTIGTAQTATFTMSGQPATGTVFASNPSGLNSSASLTATPVIGSGGIYPLEITATNSYGTATQYLTENILEAPSISSVPTSKLMVGQNRELFITANGFPRIPGFTLPSGALSNGIAVTLGAGQLPSGTAIHPAAADGSNTGEAILTGSPFPGSQGTYNITMVATSELGSSQQVLTLVVSAAGDVNGDGVVSCVDVSLVKASLNKKTGQVGYNPDADVNQDGIVDIRDQAFVTAQLPKGTKCP